MLTKVDFSQGPISKALEKATMVVEICDFFFNVIRIGVARLRQREPNENRQWQAKRVDELAKSRHIILVELSLSRWAGGVHLQFKPLA